MVLPFLYLVAALIKRSEKTPAAVQAASASYTPAVSTPVVQPEIKPVETEKKPEPLE
jgi:hypothetical protein